MTETAFKEEFYSLLKSLSTYIDKYDTKGNLLDLFYKIRDDNSDKTLENRLEIQRMMYNKFISFIESLTLEEVPPAFRFTKLQQELIIIAKDYGIKQVTFGFSESSHIKHIGEDFIISLSKKDCSDNEILLFTFFHELAHYILRHDSITYNLSLVSLESICNDLALKLIKGFGYEIKDYSKLYSKIKYNLDTYLSEEEGFKAVESVYRK